MTETPVELLAASMALRKPFPPESVGKLPRVSCTDCTKAEGKVCSKHKKQMCAECGNYISTQHIHLDFVGHALVTDRLLTVDPEWTWEPCGVDAQGLPALDRDGNLWIRLTVAGVTRLGVGDGPDMKQRVSDALRNAAMRHGVALDLWSKSELESQHDEPVETPAVASEDQVAEFYSVVSELEEPEQDAVKDWFKQHQVPKIDKASQDQAALAIAEARRVIADRHEVKTEAVS